MSCDVDSLIIQPKPCAATTPITQRRSEEIPRIVTRKPSEKVQDAGAVLVGGLLPRLGAFDGLAIGTEILTGGSSQGFACLVKTLRFGPRKRLSKCPSNLPDLFMPCALPCFLSSTWRLAAWWRGDRAVYGRFRFGCGRAFLVSTGASFCVGVVREPGLHGRRRGHHAGTARR